LEVWVVPGLAGSYEESPPTFRTSSSAIAAGARGTCSTCVYFSATEFAAVTGAIFSMGVMAYASALLWFIFLLLNTVEIALQSFFR